MAPLYPLRFQPIFRHYLWGGRRLATVLNKPLDAHVDCAESWEIVDRGVDQSVVADGPLAGATLHELVSRQGTALLGAGREQTSFPYLFKFLDAQQALSLQVHPNDEQAARLDPPDLGKTEAWVILHAEPGAHLFAGLKRGFDRAAFERELHRGTAHLCLHRIDPRPGDCVFIPAGTVHALGAGLLVAEIQQASDTTYRLSDWNRLGPDGKPRQLHLEAGLAVIDFQRGPVALQLPRAGRLPGVEQLVECDKFVLDRITLGATGSTPVGGDDQFHLLAVLDGTAELHWRNERIVLRRGGTLLLPAACGNASVTSQQAVLLDVYSPPSGVRPSK